MKNSCNKGLGLSFLNGFAGLGLLKGSVGLEYVGSQRFCTVRMCFGRVWG